MDNRNPGDENDSYFSSDFEEENAREKITQDVLYKQYVGDIMEVASTTPGARFICSLLEQLGAFDPSWSDKNARLARQVVLKDFGCSLLDDLAVASPKVHDDIQRMMRVRRKLADVLHT